MLALRMGAAAPPRSARQQTRTSHLNVLAVVTSYRPSSSASQGAASACEGERGGGWSEGRSVGRRENEEEGWEVSAARHTLSMVQISADARRRSRGEGVGCVSRGETRSVCVCVREREGKWLQRED